MKLYIKLILFTLLPFILVACASKADQMNEMKRIHAAKVLAVSSGAGPQDPELIAVDECEGTWIYIYDNSPGTSDERYEVGQKAYKQCLNNKGYS